MPTLEKIEVTAPAKTEYVQGEALDLAGMTVTAVYSDGNRKEITEGYQVTGYDANAVGEQTITVTYEGMEASFTVTVKEAETPAPTLEKIEVTAPARQSMSRAKHWILRE